MGLIASGSLSCFFGPRRQFADVIPFDQIKTRIVIENHLCFAALKYCVHSSVAGSKSVLNPCISSDEAGTPVAVAVGGLQRVVAD
jgi:hypothetical protein